MAASKTFTYKIVTAVNIDPLKALENSLKGIANAIKSISSSFKGFSTNMLPSLKQFAEGLKGVLSTITKITAGFAAAGLAGAAWFGKKVVDAGKFRQTAVTSLDVFYQGRGAAMFKNLIKMANETPADTQPLLEFAQQLAGSGFSEKQLNKLTTLRADVESAGGSQSTLDSMASVLMAAAGGGAPELGSVFIQKFLGKDRYVRYQAKAAGVKDWETGNLDVLNNKINDARKSGKLTATAMVQGIEEAALSSMKQSKIGDMSKAIASGSIAGAISNLGNVFDNMLFSTDIENRPGIKSMIKVFDKIQKVLTSDAFQQKLSKMIDSIFNAFTKMSDKDIEDWLENIVNLLSEAARAAGKVFEWFVKLGQSESIGDALLQVVKGLEMALDYIGTIIGDAIVAVIMGRESKSQKASREKVTDFAINGYQEPDWVTMKPGMKELDEEENPSWLKKSPFKVTSGVGNWVSSKNEGAITVNNNMTFHGNADPTEVKNAAESGAKAALDKANKMKDLRKAGRAS